MLLFLSAAKPNKRKVPCSKMNLLPNCVALIKGASLLTQDLNFCKVHTLERSNNIGNFMCV